MKIVIKEEKKKCPPATQDIELNLENRQKAIQEQAYGPPVAVYFVPGTVCT